MSFIKAIEKPFNNQIITFYTNDEIQDPESEELWVTGEQLGLALGYTYPGKAINNLYNRNKDFLNPFTGTLNLRTPGGKQEVRVFNETGAHIIAVKANTRQSEAYILWLNELAREKLIPKKVYDKKSHRHWMSVNGRSGVKNK